MDRPLPKEVISRNRNRLVLIGLLVVLLLAFIVWGLPRLLSSHVDQTSIHLATVETGDILQTLTASGVLVAAFERTINAPVATEIKKIHLSNGALVNPGDRIMELDQEFTALQYAQMSDELMLRENNLKKLALQYDKELRDLEFQDQIKGLQLVETDAQLKAQQRLKDVGGAAEEDIEKIRMQLQVMQLEKQMLENDLSYKRRYNAVEKENLELELNIQSKRLAELRRKLNETTVLADEQGAITWINEGIGTTVQMGDPLVRIADLSQYRVEAVTSDRNMAWLGQGTAVIVRVNREDLPGAISHILPSVENNAIRFYVRLDQPNHPLLRPNQRVDVYIVTAEKRDALRIRNGPAITSATDQDMFVVHDGMAEKIRVIKGLTNPDYVEVVSPLRAGDQVIISDISKYQHLQRFQLSKP